MRILPKSRAVLQKIVDDRGAQLRELAFEDLLKLVKPLADGPIEHITIESRPATIGVIVDVKPDGTLRVLVQGFVKARFFGKHVALDGFCKHRDGSITAISNSEFYLFD